MFRPPNLLGPIKTPLLRTFHLLFIFAFKRNNVVGVGNVLLSLQLLFIIILKINVNKTITMQIE